MSNDIGSKKVRKEMICQHLGLVQRLAKRFKNRGIPYEDLVQIGSLGLIKAVDSFTQATVPSSLLLQRPTSSEKSNITFGTTDGI